MPPENVDTTRLPPRLAVPPTTTPLAPAEIAPELLMPPEKLEIVTGVVVLVAKPPTKMAVLIAVETVPELLMPPAPNTFTPWTKIPVKVALMTPALVIPPRNEVTQLQISIPVAPAIVAPAALTMLPTKEAVCSTLMPAPAPEIAPLLVMPPPKIETPLTTMPEPPTDSVPALLMPPAKLGPAITIAFVPVI